MLALCLVIWILAIGLGGVIGLIAGPFLFYNNNHWAQNVCCALLCPLTMPIGAVVGVFLAFGYGIFMLGSGLAATLLTLKALWCQC